MRVILFANSEFDRDISNQISDDDYIVRFNIPSEKNLNLTANRTDILFLANTCELLDKLVDDDLFDKTVIQQHPKVVFPYTNDVIKSYKSFYLKRYIRFIRWFYEKQNYNNEQYLTLFAEHGLNVDVLPEQYYRRLRKRLELEKQYLPSTGLIALYYFLSHPTYKKVPIFLHGFEFTGWDGHAWGKEKQFVNSLVERGRIFLM